MTQLGLNLESFGFLYGKSGLHTARTLMLEKLGNLLETVNESNVSQNPKELNKA